MATTGLEVFDKTLHTTNLWLDEINAEIGPDRHLAWHVLGAVLRSLRDEMQVEQSAHFAAQLPLLIRGAYFDQYRPAQQPVSVRSQEAFIARVQFDLDGCRPVNAEQAAATVMRTLNRHLTEGQIRKVRDALPKGVRAIWPEPCHKEPEHKEPEHAGAGKQQPSPEQPAASHGAQPRSGAQHAEPPRPASQPPSPQSPPPQHTAPQTSQHPAPDRPVREWEDIEFKEEILEEGEDIPSVAKSSSPSSSKGAHIPIGAASQPARFQTAPAGDRTAPARKATKARGKRKDG